MNIVLDCLCEFGFRRLSNKLGKPVVVNCVPGAGKTTLIRKVLSLSLDCVAFTTGEPDCISLTGNHIKRWEGHLIPGKVNILDEYQRLTTLPEGFDFIFGDPTQALHPNVLEPCFVSYYSHRFGSETAALLQRLGFEIQAEGEDQVIVGDLYKVDPIGTIICFQEEVCKLLKAHGLDFHGVSDIIGATYDTVTFYCSGPFNHSQAHLFLICLTRHRKKLLVLCPEGALCN
ncbi:MAG: TGB1 protein [Hainan betaflexivirus]|nr:MAG: TGB1 protein [Hainan betaflexivirus]